MLFSEVGSSPTFTEIIYTMLARKVILHNDKFHISEACFRNKEDAHSYIKGLSVIDSFYFVANRPVEELETEETIHVKPVSKWKTERRCTACEHIFKIRDEYFNDGKCPYCLEETGRFGIIAEYNLLTFKLEKVTYEKTYYKKVKRYILWGEERTVKKVMRYKKVRKNYKESD